MKARDLRELGADELAHKIRETRRQVKDLRLRVRGRMEDKPVRIRTLRRDLARMLTVAAGREKVS